jgi:signal transduction histidine kinase/ActR/RegA family two-component response regulator
VVEERILVWAPPRDARLTREFLEESGIVCTDCPTWETLATEWQKGAGALIVAGELLSASVVANLHAMLSAQATWSDPAIIVVAGDAEPEHLEAFGVLGNVSFLQRPLSLKTLRSTVRAALRARRRQYQVRDLLDQKDQADRRKDEFLAMLAHELRNPLAPLRTGLHLLRLGPSPDTAARTIAMMERQITNLSRLIDDLLDVSRITRRKIALRKQPADLRESVTQAVAAVQRLAAEKGLRLELDTLPGPLVVEADSVRLEQMIGNVLNNAIKFTPPSGQVMVSAAAEDGCAVLRVRDSGIGIPQDQLSHVFELFMQAPRALDRSDGGLGIGLTVVRLLAELHGGTVEIQSEGAGAGTQVTLRLPLTLAAEFSPAEATIQTDAPMSSRRILVIEDNREFAEMLGEYLTHLGHRVVTAHDGFAGLEAALRHHPDVIICDIGLPGVDGYEIAQRLSQQADFRSCLMIAITGYGDVADRERARKAGFAYHLTKPADPTWVARLIASAPVPAGEPVRSGKRS